uniref:Uncharacterized protein n=1 Tax=Panagrolaimus sp. PS1159 TaxID=55785 RepID=A0AC35FBZ3_9BILA
MADQAGDYAEAARDAAGNLMEDAGDKLHSAGKKLKSTDKDDVKDAANRAGEKLKETGEDVQSGGIYEKRIYSTLKFLSIFLSYFNYCYLPPSKIYLLLNLCILFCLFEIFSLNVLFLPPSFLYLSLLINELVVKSKLHNVYASI